MITQFKDFVSSSTTGELRRMRNDLSNGVNNWGKRLPSETKKLRRKLEIVQKEIDHREEQAKAKMIVKRLLLTYGRRTFNYIKAEFNGRL